MIPMLCLFFCLFGSFWGVWSYLQRFSDVDDLRWYALIPGLALLCVCLWLCGDFGLIRQLFSDFDGWWWYVLMHGLALLCVCLGLFGDFGLIVNFLLVLIIDGGRCSFTVWSFFVFVWGSLGTFVLYPTCLLFSCWFVVRTSSWSLFLLLWIRVCLV